MLFSGCSSLCDIALPANLRTLGNGAFRHCTSLLFLAIPNKVTDIGLYAFQNCSRINNIIIGESVKVMSEAFYDCQASAVTVLATEPPAASGAFSGNDRRIYVKKESLEAYRNNDEWRNMVRYCL